VQSVANVCGQCHGREAALFRQSPKKELFDDMDVAECTICHGNHSISHPTPELIYSEAAPTVGPGEVIQADPFMARVAELPAGETLTATWRCVLRPHTRADDERLIHHIEVSASEIEALVLDASAFPGGDEELLTEARSVQTPELTASLQIESLSGLPLEAGDALRFHLTLTASSPLTGLTIQDAPGEVLEPVAGSICLTCHTPGDDCDQATYRMYEALNSLDRSLRGAASLLHRAEVAGMDVSESQFMLKSKGTTAAIEARALVHAFDPEKLIEKVDQGTEVAVETRTAALNALAEVQTRRRGLAVSLVFVVIVLALLYGKIRQIDRRG
jgi:hypothetical protein